MTAPKAPTPQPKEFDLCIPGGTYMATPTYVVIDKAGQWFATSMGSARAPKGQFGIHVWYRIAMSKPWQLLFFRNNSHGNLTVLQGNLYFIVNNPNGVITALMIQQYKGLPV